MKKAKQILGAAFVVSILVAAMAYGGTMDAAEAEREAQRYCSMVGQGAWPDYKGTFNDYCNN